MRTAVIVYATILVVLEVLPISGSPSPGYGPSSRHPAPLLFPQPRTETASEGPRIVEVYYHAVRDNEYIAVGNGGAAPIDLSGWTLTDLEGSASFPAGNVLPAHGVVVATRNATSYAEDTRRSADFTYDRGDAPRMSVARVPRLANDGDEVLLTDPRGTVVDALAWGDSTYGGPGWSGAPADGVPRGHRMVRVSLGAGWADTDSADDWNALRTYPLGHVDRPLRSFAVEAVTPFLSPDDARSVLSQRLSTATRTVYLAVYEFTSEELGTAVEAAARRGLDVRVLLEGSPVGGLDEREWSIARNLTAAGVQVRFLAGALDGGVVARYRFLHAKYAVFDNETSVVGSENWGTHGFPPPSSAGNRGWHVAVRDRSLGTYLAEVFLDDFDAGHRDSIGFADLRARVVPPRRDGPWGAREGSMPSRTIVGPIVVTPVLGSDHTLRDDALLGALQSARQSIDIEQLLADPRWGDEPNPYVDAVVAAARRGVRVRLLLDGSSFGPARGDALGNRATAEALNGIARAEALPLEARLFPPGADGIVKVHAKGLVVDGRIAFASSLNWNQNSATRNREVGLLVDSPGVAAFFGAAFERDWVAAADPPMIPLVDLGPPVAIGAACSVALWFFIRRRRAKQL